MVGFDEKLPGVVLDGADDGMEEETWTGLEFGFISVDSVPINDRDKLKLDSIWLKSSTL